MTALQTACNIIRKYEGCVLHAYPDPATGGKPWTIGWGTTFYDGGRDVQPGDKITQAEADRLLEMHVNDFMGDVQDELKKPVTDNQLAALTSFAYNVGVGNYRKSTLLKKVNVNPEDATIRDEFGKWIKANGKVFPGLVKRRKAEADLYFTK